MKYQEAFKIDRSEAVNLYWWHIKDAQRCIRYALWARSSKGALDQDWLRYAREASQKARLWAKKLGIHFGMESTADRARRQAEINLRLEAAKIVDRQLIKEAA